MNANEDINISKINAMKKKWTDEDPHHFMDKSALDERKAYMKKMRRAERLEGFKRYVKFVLKTKKDENRE